MSISIFSSSRGISAASAFALVAGGVLLGAPAASAAQSGQACEPGQGVTVVVDFTDLGGDLQIGCAKGDPANGREALEAAGFKPVDSQPGLICTINSQPDPCPTEFTGSFWSYWHADASGDWQSYMVGADSSDPAVGELEGWRYSDGTAGPTISPADAAAALPAETPTQDSGDQPVTTTTSSGALGDVLLYSTIAFAVAVIVVIGLLVLRSRRKQTEDSSKSDLG